MSILIVVESVKKCEIIKSYLGKEYDCVSCNGPINTISVDSSLNNITYNLLKTPMGIVVYNNLKNKIQSALVVIMAMDNDGEGETIAWHICNEFGLPLQTTSRMIFNDMTRQTILNSLKTPNIINAKLVESYRTRQIVDEMFKFYISPKLWKYIPTIKSSANRYQISLLRSFYNSTSTSIIHDEINAQFSQFDNIKFTLIQHNPLSTSDSVIEFLEKSIDFQHILTCGLPDTKTIHSPALFNLSSLLQHAETKLDMSPKETLLSCQLLYENGHITNDYQIRATDICAMSNCCTTIYKAILNRTMAHCMPDKVTRTFPIYITCPDLQNTYVHYANDCVEK